MPATKRRTTKRKPPRKRQPESSDEPRLEVHQISLRPLDQGWLMTAIVGDRQTLLRTKKERVFYLEMDAVLKLLGFVLLAAIGLLLCAERGVAGDDVLDLLRDDAQQQAQHWQQVVDGEREREAQRDDAWARARQLEDEEARRQAWLAAQPPPPPAVGRGRHAARVAGAGQAGGQRIHGARRAQLSPEQQRRLAIAAHSVANRNAALARGNARSQLIAAAQQSLWAEIVRRSLP